MIDLNLKILSKREEFNNGKKNTCYICEGNLDDYVKSIPDRYKEYDIQRGIIKNNVYLDKLTKTILENKFIPSIVLVAKSEDDTTIEYDTTLECDILTIRNQSYKILDGLQRSYRIKQIYRAYNLYISLVDDNKKEHIESLTKYKISREFKEELDKYKTDVSYLWSIMEFYRGKTTINHTIFNDFIQWFEVWVGLDKNEQINKMLVLNAGHKSMDLKHQLELLFLNVVPENYLNEFIRSKDISSATFYKKKEEGDLHLTHFISALIAFDKSAPILVNQQYLQEIHENPDTELEEVKKYFMEDNLEIFIRFLKNIDELINKQYGKTGLEWIGRESVLIGLFAAFGKYFEREYDNNIEKLEECLNNIQTQLTANIDTLDIEAFNQAKTSVNIAKVNIGDLFKYSTFYYFCQMLIHKNKQLDWKMIFTEKTKSEIKNECY